MATEVYNQLGSSAEQRASGTCHHSAQVLHIPGKDKHDTKHALPESEMHVWGAWSHKAQVLHIPGKVLMYHACIWRQVFDNMLLTCCMLQVGADNHAE